MTDLSSAASPPASPPPGASPPAPVGQPGPARPARSAHPALGLLILLVVLAVALAIGSGVGSGGHQTNAQRATALDAEIRCPSCEDLSVAQSSASAAVAVRHQVARLVAEGRTDQQIEDALVAQYGPTILLRPPTTGLTSLVWIVPAVAGALAVGAIGVLFWRRSKEMERLRREGR
ncbi:MAG TPA: cytochrome c-type biogenesis protein CcmH [Acidimicrobiales bacterium]|nr:cytochrome c-type biogenesis protein CcmH [Acidimicrobiales bacterium]